MFLSELSFEEKKAFLEAANKLIYADANKTDEEDTLLLQYQKEMYLNKAEYKIGELAYESSIEILMKMSNNMKKKVFFELLALAMCDHEYNYQEKDYIKDLQNLFSINDEQVDGLIKCIEEINEIYKKLGELLNE